MNKSTAFDRYADVVIIGAGHSGLNALVAANNYLIDNEYALIADLRPTVGGQWLDVYSYVRVHQPYQLFTAYDKPWHINRDRWHLATKHEVLDHFQSIVEGEIATHGTQTLFEHRFILHDMINGHVHVVFESVHRPKVRLVVRTKRLIDAVSVSIRTVEPLELSSSRVTPVTPEMLPRIVSECSERHRRTGSRYHFVIIGSGKTATDTVQFLDDSLPAPVCTQSMVAGGGMAFICRDEAFPKTTTARWLSGFTPLDYYAYVANEWDGNNHHELMKELIDCGQIITYVDDPYATMFGLISRKEIEHVKRILADNAVKGRLEDVIDIHDRPTLVMQDGTEMGIPGLDAISGEGFEEIFIVNCTQLLFDRKPERPLLSVNGMMLSPQTALLLPGPTASFITHLWFTGKLKSIEHLFYRIHFPTTAEEKEMFFFRACLASLNNNLVLVDELPFQVLCNDRTSPLKWIPWHRQFMSLLKIKMLRHRLRDKCHKLLGPQMKYYSLK